MRLKKLYKKYFREGNVIITGLRGRGKDLLMSNIIDRFTDNYISNIDYNVSSNFIKLDFSKLDCKNTYDNLINGNINYYDYPYPLNTDIFITDAGIYLPSQYCNELNKKYSYLATFYALSRHFGKGTNFHANIQNIGRLYDKLREQSDFYITCNKCIYLFGLVIQIITIYDKYDSCLNRVEPFKPLSAPLLATRDTKGLFKVKNEELLRSFKERNGSVKRRLLIYFNKSKYDTYYFKNLFLGGVKIE